MHREQLIWLESENALLDMLLQDGKDSGLDIFLFFVKLIYSKRNNNSIALRYTIIKYFFLFLILYHKSNLDYYCHL